MDFGANDMAPSISVATPRVVDFVARRPEPAPHPDEFASMFEQVAPVAKIGMWTCDLPSQQLQWSDGVYDMFGLPRRSAIRRRDILELYDERSQRELQRLRDEAIRSCSGFMLEARIMTPGRSERWIRIHANAKLQDGQHRLFGLKQDITDERARFELWRAMAETDAVTGLANRAKFQATLHDALRHGGSGALLFADLDAFKAVNDTFGHAAGDACLVAFGGRLRETFPQARLIARVGGDEFAVLVATADVDMLGGLVEGLLARMQQPVRWARRRLALGASVGIACYSAGDVTDPSVVCRQADQALYVAKAAGRCTYSFYRDDLPVPAPVEGNRRAFRR